MICLDIFTAKSSVPAGFDYRDGIVLNLHSASKLGNTLLHLQVKIVSITVSNSKVNIHERVCTQKQINIGRIAIDVKGEEV